MKTSKTDSMGRAIIWEGPDCHIAQDDRGRITVVCKGLPARKAKDRTDALVMVNAYMMRH